MPIKITNTYLDGLFIIEPEFFNDERGSFYESFNFQDFSNLTTENFSFVLDCHSHSKKNVLRGLHYQLNNPQGKLVRVIHGEIQDVVVDIRKKSKTFGKYFSINLSSQSLKQLWIPPGFAHGFLAKTKSVDVLYKMTNFWDKNDERCILWNDKNLAISWEADENNILTSSKDEKGCKFSDAEYFN